MTPCEVFVLQHVRIQADGGENVKMIGVYESRIAAEQAVERLVKQPGFRDNPKIIDLPEDGEESGFSIDRYPVGQDHWAEGFGDS